MLLFQVVADVFGRDGCRQIREFEISAVPPESWPLYLALRKPFGRSGCESLETCELLNRVLAVPPVSIEIVSAA